MTIQTKKRSFAWMAGWLLCITLIAAQEQGDPATDDIPEFLQQPAMSPSESPDAASHAFVAGRIFPLFYGLKRVVRKQGAIWSVLQDIFHLGDIMPLVLLGWTLIPIVELLYNKLELEPIFYRKDEAAESYRPAFRDTFMYFMLANLSGVAKIGLLVYGVDLLGIVASDVGFKGVAGVWKNGLSQSVAVVLYTLWITIRIKRFKRDVVFQRLAKGPSADEGKAELVNHALNAVLYAVALIVLAELLSVNMGIALSSFFAFGGAGTLTLSLASKDIAKELLSGLAMTMSDQYHHGEEVILENGKGGFIQKIGWTHTLFRNYNELLVRIPNSKLHGQTVSNLSRGKMSQVAHVLRLKQSDLPKIDALIVDIKEEVLKATAPHVVTNGSRPFRAHLRDIGDDHLSVVCDFHFHIPPTGEVYWDNRQRVLRAIERALAKNDCQLSTSNWFGNPLNQRSY